MSRPAPVNRPAHAPDVAIIGGGIVGTAAAAFLAAAGARVRLYERTAIAAGASGRNSGVVQHPFDPILADLYRATLAEYRAMGQHDVGFALADEPAGLLYIGHRQDRVAEAAAAWTAAWPASRPEVLAGQELERLEPALAAGLTACRLAIGFPVPPAAATHGFALAGARDGVETVLGEAEPSIVDGRAIGVRIDGRFEPAGAVLVAAGPWTPALIDPTGAWRPIRSVWGVVAGLALARAPSHVLEADDIEIEPEPDSDDATDAAAIQATTAAEVGFSLVPATGSSALGSTFLAAEPEPAAWLPTLRRVGARYVPQVAGAQLVGLRHCARPVSADGRPLVGAIGGISGLFVAAGHGPWGISTGPGSARLVADLILGRIGQRDLPDPLDPARFGSVGPDQRQDSGSSR